MKTAIHDEGAQTPPPARFNMAAHVLRHADDLPEKPALELLSPGQPAHIWSFRDVARAVRGLATGLLARGLTPGDHILMRLSNSVDFPITYLACITAGLIPIPTSSQLTKREITKIADEIAPKLIIATQGIALPDHPAPILNAAQLPALYTLPPAAFDLGDPNRPAYMIYTSGTSGIPRAVIHAHRAIWAREMMHEGWYGLRQNDRLMHAGAFNWTYTLGTGLMDPWSAGATALIAAEGTSPNEFPALIAKHNATIFAAVPGVYRQILKQDIPAMPHLRHGLSAGEKLSPAIRAAWNNATNTHIFEAFGMSECSTFISGSPAHPAPQGALGYPQKGRRVAILGENGLAARDEPGILPISARDNGLMLGYYGAPEATKEKFIETKSGATSEHWFATGDSALMAQDGAITYLGRADDMMNAGGFRVSPIEIESVFNAHEAIHESAAVALTVKANTTVICLYYTADAPLAEALLSDIAADTLARYKQPRKFVHVAQLPKNANGKLLRKQLREAD
ncbi:MAG: class I adenylate-forming enzyme family protein [Paracoccaceae bacterium]